MKKQVKIAVLSGKGGVGKSLIASSLALLFSRSLKTLLLDCDVDAPNLSIWLNIKNWDRIKKTKNSFLPQIDYKKCKNCGKCIENCKFNALKFEKGKLRVNKFLCEGCGVCELVCPENAIKLKLVENGLIRFKKMNKNLYLISGQLYPGQTGSGKIVSEIKDESLNLKFDPQLIILDLAPGTGCPVIAGLLNVDFAVLVAEPFPASFTDLKRVLQLVNYFKIKWFLVVNKWDLNQNFGEKIKRWAGNKFLGKISYNKEIFNLLARFIHPLRSNLSTKEELEKIFENLKERLK